MARKREIGEEPTVIECPSCQTEVSTAEIYTCQECGGPFCDDCGSLAYYCCDGCLNDLEDEENGENND